MRWCAWPDGFMVFSSIRDTAAIGAYFTLHRRSQDFRCGLLWSILASDQNSNIALKFSDPDFLKWSNNLAIKRRFHAVTLTVDTWTWTCVVNPLSRDQTLYQIWPKSNKLWRSYWWFSTFSPALRHVRCDLDLWPRDLERLDRYHVFKPCTKFDRNWTIRGWVIGHLIHFVKN